MIVIVFAKALAILPTTNLVTALMKPVKAILVMVSIKNVVVYVLIILTAIAIYRLAI